VSWYLKLPINWGLTEREAKRIVRVWDKPCFVIVRQTPQSAWLAMGDYMGEPIECRASTKHSALASWHDTARFKGGLYHREP
jgi:hypothetical protein